MGLMLRRTRPPHTPEADHVEQLLLMAQCSQSVAEAVRAYMMMMQFHDMML